MTLNRQHGIEDIQPRRVNSPKRPRNATRGPQIIERACLSFRLSLGGSAADALGLRALQVGCRNPALVVRLCARGNSGAISANNSDLVGGVDLLGAEGGLLRTLTTLAAALLLGEESGDPGVVDKVRDAAEDAENDEVQEDAVVALGRVVLRLYGMRIDTYIWGSKKLVAPSTIVTVSL
jgi:hypothetical protein